MFGIGPEILYSSLERTAFWEGFARANWSKSGRVERIDRMAQANKSLKGFARAKLRSLERTTSSQERSSEERGRLERPRFCEGFARVRLSSLERTAPEQEGSSEGSGWLKR
ncbi:hypothetical protein AAC387_Pa03g1449 [Persea americana]